MEVQDSTADYAAPRFTVRGLLIAVTLLALGFGWYMSLKRARDQNARMYRSLSAAQLELRMAEGRANLQADPTEGDYALASGTLVGAFLRGVVIDGGDGAFQLSRFAEADLTDATLTGGASSFQGASFDRANLTRAKLAGGVASFQMATFEQATLTGATVTGNLQGASFARAVCVGATIKGNMQGANIDGVRFEGADLSAIKRQNLQSCYFEDPPTYDAQTSFPPGFDPQWMGWRNVADDSP